MAEPPRALDLKTEKAAITQLRRANNEAITARDLEGTMRMLADDYAVVAGSDVIIRSKAESRQRWAKDFASAHPINQCVRRPRTITVGEAGGVLRAAEYGTWECHGERPTGAVMSYGPYFAHWSKRTSEWRVVSDNYVALGCRGPGC